MTAQSKREKAQAKQQAALEKLEQGILDLATEADWRKYLNFQSRFYNYSAKNTMLIYGQCPDASHVAGYRAWQKLGRQVRSFHWWERKETQPPRLPLVLSSDPIFATHPFKPGYWTGLFSLKKT